MSDPSVNSGKPRRRLSPGEKYQLVCGGAHRAGRAAGGCGQVGVDRSTVVHICRTAKQGALDALAASVPGRAGQSVEQAALAAAGHQT
jgi:hypothetical protein